MPKTSTASMGATEGKLSSEQYVVQMVLAESRAAEKTRAFYIHFFFALAKEHRVRADPAIWRIGERSKPSDVLVLSNALRHRMSGYWHYESCYPGPVAQTRTRNGDAASF